MRESASSLAVLVLTAGVALGGCTHDEKRRSAASSSTSAPTTATTLETTTTTAPTTTTTAPGLSDASRVGFEGIGPVRIGMTLAQASAAVGKPFRLEDTEVSEGCAFAVVEGGPKGLSFMVGRDTNNGPWRVLRTDVDEGSAIATISGIRLGATEAQVKAAYQGPGKGGSLTVETHPYVPTGHYLLYDVDGKGGRLLIFETDGTKVTEFRAGDEAAVQAIEGCA